MPWLGPGSGLSAGEAGASAGVSEPESMPAALAHRPAPGAVIQNCWDLGYVVGPPLKELQWSEDCYPCYVGCSVTIKHRTWGSVVL